MTGHNTFLLGAAVIFFVTNWVGAGLTIRRVLGKRRPATMGPSLELLSGGVFALLAFGVIALITALVRT